MKAFTLSAALLTCALTCAGQTSAPNSPAAQPTNNVTGQPAGLILVAPNVALPGDGPATGAPNSVNNDPRNSGGISVFDPNVIPQPASATGQSANLETGAAAPANLPGGVFNPGIQNFAGSNSMAGNGEAQSLGEIARYYKAHKPKSRLITNDELSRLNPNAPVSVVGPGAEQTEAASATTPTTPEANQPTAQSPALPAGDVNAPASPGTQPTATEPAAAEPTTQPQAGTTPAARPAGAKPSPIRQQAAPKK
jgi:hypothetical protein